MKVVKSNVSNDEISSVIDLVGDLEVSSSTKDRIKEEVGQYLIEQTLLSVGDAKSPISGEGWKKSLSPAYKKEKEEYGGTLVANMELKGDMLSALGFEKTEEGIKIGVFGDEAPKADGHNNFSGDSELPKRRFLPEEGQEYKSQIEKGVKEIINDILAEETDFKKSDFKGVETKSDLYDVLSGMFGKDMSAAEIKRAAFGNSTLHEILDELDLLELL